MPQRVAVVSNNAFTLVNFRGPLIADMVRRGHSVFALAPDYDAEQRARVEGLGATAVAIPLDRSGLRPTHDLADVLRLARILRGLRVDVVFSYFLKPVILGMIAGWLARIPRRYALVAGLGYVFTDRVGARSARKRAMQRIVTRVLGIAFDRADRVFFQNRDDLEHFLSVGAIKGDKAVVVEGTGIDLDIFAQVPLPTGPCRFLFVGRLLREKGVAELMEAARLLRAWAIDCEIVIAGGIDSNRGALSAEEIAAYAKEGVARFIGHVEDIRGELAKATVFVLPSYREGKPRSTQEALAVGRPVITTNAIGCRDTVVPGVNGWMVPVADAASLAAAMMEAVGDRSRLLAMADASRALAERTFDVRAINQRMLETMELA